MKMLVSEASQKIKTKLLLGEKNKKKPFRFLNSYKFSSFLKGVATSILIPLEVTQS